MWHIGFGIVLVLFKKIVKIFLSLQHFGGKQCASFYVNIVFLPARRYASAGLCDSDVSVCVSVCLSVTCRYCA